LRAVSLAACEPKSATPNAGPDAAATEPPAPYVPAASGAPECELSADCPAGTHCDLGECIQRCNIVDPCTGELTCTPRGRCDEDSVDEDPAPDEAPRAAVTAAPLALDIGEDVSAVMLGVDAAPTTTALAYRVDSRVAWLRPVTARGTFTGALVTMLEVDRTGYMAARVRRRRRAGLTGRSDWAKAPPRVRPSRPSNG